MMETRILEALERIEQEQKELRRIIEGAANDASFMREQVEDLLAGVASHPLLGGLVSK